MDYSCFECRPSNAQVALDIAFNVFEFLTNNAMLRINDKNRNSNIIQYIIM